MAWRIDVDCSKCSYHSEFIEGLPRVYVLQDGSRIDVPAHNAWCRICDCMIEAEMLPKLDRIDQIPQKAATKKGEAAIHGTEVNPHWIERLKSWRRGRKTGPRCLECGSQDLMEGDANTQSIPHHCGGRLALRLRAQISSPPSTLLYHPEGHRLGAGQAPPGATIPMFLRSSTQPCSYCGAPLRTNEARQCFECGMDWHDEDHPVRRGK